MRRIWSVVCLVALVAVVLEFAASCRKDIFVPPPPSIIGTYRGYYSYSEDNLNGTPDDDIDTGQFVKVWFRADQWIMKIDTLKTKNIARMACDCAGEYTLDNGVQMDTTNANLGQDVCTFSWLPFGSFQLIQDDNDSLCKVKLTRVYDYTDPNNRTYKITKQLCLYPSIL